MAIRYTRGWLWVFLFSLMSCGILKPGRHPKGIISAAEAPPAKLITSFSFRQLIGGVIVVKGQVNDIGDTLNFILDTGSGGISLDSVTVGQLGLKTKPSGLFVRGIGGVKKLYFAYDNSLSLSGLKIDSLDFYINNYSFISAVYGIHIDGIIGYSFLKDYIVRIDYDHKKIWIFSPGRYVYPPSGLLLHPDLRKIPVFHAVVRNKEMPVHSRYYFDMGTGLCLMLSNKFADDSSLFESHRQRRHKFVPTVIQGFTGQIHMVKTVIGRLRVGPFRFRNVPVYLFDDVSNITSYPLLGGIIGNDLLRRFNVTLNYPEDEIYLLPNTFFREPFDYSYTGFTLYLLDGQIVVEQVLEGSPADKSGFKPGDIIMAIDGHFGNDLQAFHKLLKKTGTAVDILILRDGVPFKKRLKIKSIL